MSILNKRIFQKQWAQNIKTYGLKVGSMVTKELFSSESAQNKLIQHEEKKLADQKQLEQKLDKTEFKLIKEHGFVKGKEMFNAMVKNNSFPSGSIHSQSTNENNDQYLKHPNYKAFEQKYGEETAIDMISEMQTDPDFLNKLQQSEKEDAESGQQRVKDQAAKIAQALNKNTESSKPVNKNSVDFDAIDKLQHNKEYDWNNQIQVSKTEGLSGQKLIDQLEHNKNYDHNACK